MHQVEDQLSEATAKVSEYESMISTLTASQSKLQTENNDLSTQLGEAESQVGTLTKNKSSLTAQVEELKSDLESETSVSIIIIACVNGCCGYLRIDYNLACVGTVSTLLSFRSQWVIFVSTNNYSYEQPFYVF